MRFIGMTTCMCGTPFIDLPYLCIFSCSLTASSSNKRARGYCQGDLLSLHVCHSLKRMGRCWHGVVQYKCCRTCSNGATPTNNGGGGSSGRRHQRNNQNKNNRHAQTQGGQRRRKRPRQRKQHPQRNNNNNNEG